ncbi:cupin domain-containing protein [Desulfonatronum parangueonense]
MRHIECLKVVMAVCLFQFFTSPLAADSPGIQVRELVRTEKSWDGNLLPPYPEGQPEIRILSITIAPGEKLPIHRHPVINAGYLLSGHLRVHTLDGKVLDLRAGETIVEVVDTWHWGESLGEEPAQIIVFYAGKAGVPITTLRE